MIVVAAPMVFRNVHPPDEQFMVVEITIAVGQRSFSQPQRLDLRTRQNDTRNIGVEHLVIVSRPLIFNGYVFPVVHGRLFSVLRFSGTAFASLFIVARMTVRFPSGMISRLKILA